MRRLAASSMWRLPLLALLLASTTAAQRETFVPANDVSFSISTEERAYKAGDQIVVRFSIVNTSNKPMYVPREWEAKCPSSPHVWAWFEDSDGKHFVPGYGGSCTHQPKSVTDRMGKEAVLLKPNQHLAGAFRLDSSLFGGLPAGEYRIEARLPGWREQDFTDAEWSELTKMGGGFLRGEVPASARVTLTF
jgi:hypothetical protein